MYPKSCTAKSSSYLLFHPHPPPDPQDPQTIDFWFWTCLWSKTNLTISSFLTSPPRPRSNESNRPNRPNPVFVFFIHYFFHHSSLRDQAHTSSNSSIIRPTLRFWDGVFIFYYISRFFSTITKKPTKLKTNRMKLILGGVVVYIYIYNINRVRSKQKRRGLHDRLNPDYRTTWYKIEILSFSDNPVFFLNTIWCAAVCSSHTKSYLGSLRWGRPTIVILWSNHQNFIYIEAFTSTSRRLLNTTTSPSITLNCVPPNPMTAIRSDNHFQIFSLKRCVTAVSLSSSSLTLPRKREREINIL